MKVSEKIQELLTECPEIYDYEEMTEEDREKLHNDNCDYILKRDAAIIAARTAAIKSTQGLIEKILTVY